MADPKDKKKDEKEQERASASEQAKAPVGEKKPSAEAIAKAIDGIQFRTNKALPVIDDSTGKPVTEGGKPKVRYVPDLRPMTPADVLSARYYDGDMLLIVSKDGSKYRK